MSSAKLLLATWLALSAGAGAGVAADPMRCLGTEQRRAAIVSHKAIPLARAVRAARGRHAGDLVGARLCESGPGLVYVLTLLSRDGKVTRATIDAGSGRLIGRR